VVPDLVVEVLCSQRSYDRITKRVLYAGRGLEENHPTWCHLGRFAEVSACS